jgi:hypothetical protein
MLRGAAWRRDLTRFQTEMEAVARLQHYESRYEFPHSKKSRKNIRCRETLGSRLQLS